MGKTRRGGRNCESDTKIEFIMKKPRGANLQFAPRGFIFKLSVNEKDYITLFALFSHLNNSTGIIS